MKKLFTVLFLLANITISAQETVKIVTYTPYNSGSISSKPTRPYPKNSVKVNPFLFARGLVMFNYERQLTDYMSIEGGLGLIYSHDMLFEFSYNMSPEYDELETGYKKTEMRPAYEIGLKFFPGNDGFLDELYISPMYSYRSYRFNRSSDTHEKFGYDFTDINLRVGIQDENWWSWNIYYDMYLGLGYRMAEIHRSTIPGNEFIIPSTEKNNRLQILMGLKISIPF